ncbi:hypothetical protein H2201_007370 [Coniosporium apollinis]|uniref:Uncharacterized protein n=1 Tax=Coniosporium apollinis TaxID=61459 RepID=A0ABQ9NLX7_9PEZI|nr:hypothetical protein H2201_007370 [Coniosporium apollinis]
MSPFLHRTAAYVSHAKTVYIILICLNIIVYISGATTVFIYTFIERKRLPPGLIIASAVILSLSTAALFAYWLMVRLWRTETADSAGDAEDGWPKGNRGSGSGSMTNNPPGSVHSRPAPSSEYHQSDHTPTPTPSSRSYSFSPSPALAANAATVNPVTTARANYNPTVEDHKEEPQHESPPAPPPPAPRSPQASSTSIKRRSWKNPAQQHQQGSQQQHQQSTPSMPGEGAHEKWKKRTSRLPEGMRAGYADEEVF